MIVWEPSDSWSDVLAKIQLASGVVIIYVTDTGGGGRTITSGAYDWTSVSWIGMPSPTTLHVAEGVQLNPGIIHSDGVNFLIETTNTPITDNSQTINFVLRNCEIVSQGGPVVPFQPNQFSDFEIDMVDATMRTTSGAPALVHFQQNSIPSPFKATHSKFDTPVGVNAPIFSLASGSRILVQHDSATRFATLMTTGAGTLITNTATAMESKAAREFYDDLFISGSAGPSLIAFGTAPSVQAAIDRLKQAQVVSLGQFQPSGTPTFGPSGMLIQYATAIAKIGALRHTTVGTLSGAIFFDQTGYYRIGYSVNATGSPSGMPWEAHCRLAALGNPAGGTNIPQSLAFGVGDGSISKSFLVLVPSAISFSVFAQTVRPISGTSIARLQATGTDLAVEYVRSVNPLPYGP